MAGAKKMPKGYGGKKNPANQKGHSGDPLGSFTHRLEHELLVIAYWWHRGGATTLIPDWVKRHPMWPDNNADQDPRIQRTSRWPGKERLWEAIRKQYSIEGPAHED